jgi:maltooligosyltrehalose synthase
VVYNHLGPEGNYLSEFGPYFTDRYKTPWGESHILLPEEAPSRWKEAITGKEVTSDRTLFVGDVLKDYPMALLVGET